MSVASRPTDLPMLPSDRLRDKLIVLNNKNVQAYQELVGAFRFERFVLSIEHVPPDPVVAPAYARLKIDQAEAQIPPALWATPMAKVAVEDFLARAVHDAIRRHVRTRWSGRIPPLSIDAGGQQVLQRASSAVAPDFVEMRLALGLPAENRKILAKAAQGLFFEELPVVVNAGLTWSAVGEAGHRHAAIVEDYLALRDALAPRGLVSFLADGAVAAREQGPGDGPIRGGRAVALRAPDSLAVTIALPHRGEVRGLGIRQGVSVITGGAFAGKSTLARAIGRGVYPHVPGDGRELVATAPDAVTIRAEPGRRVERVDLRMFFREIPQRFDVSALSLDHVSGPMSMAAAIVEALEVGTRLLIVDEDDAAVAFLARDAMMQQLIPAAREPLTRLLDVVRALWEGHGVSSIIVTSGLGDYLEAADTVILMDAFKPHDATPQVRTLGEGRPVHRLPETRVVSLPAPRCPQPKGLGSLRGRRQWSEVRGRGLLNIGREIVDLSALPQAVDTSQARAAGDAVLYALDKGYFDGAASMTEVLDRVFADVAASGLPVLAVHAGQPADYALPRRHEVAAVLNRMRAFQARTRRPDAAGPEGDAPPQGPQVIDTPEPEAPSGESDLEAPEAQPAAPPEHDPGTGP